MDFQLKSDKGGQLNCNKHFKSSNLFHKNMQINLFTNYLFIWDYTLHYIHMADICHKATRINMFKKMIYLRRQIIFVILYLLLIVSLYNYV